MTVVTAAGCTAAWLRGWPAVRLRHAAVFFLPFTAWWLGLAWARQGSWRGIVDALVHDWARGSWPLTRLDPTWAFLQVSLVAIPAGLGLAALVLVVAELRDEQRDRRLAGLGAGHVRRPAVETPGRAGPAK